MRVLPPPTVILGCLNYPLPLVCCLNNNALKTQYAVSLLTIQ